MPIYLGLDLGTTSVAAVAIDQQQLLKSATRAHNAAVTGLPEGHAEQDFETLLQAAQACLAEVIAACAEPPAGLGLTGQMHGFLLRNPNGAPLSQLITWQDRRCLEANASGQSFLEELRSRLSSDIRDKLGCQIRPGYTIASWFALQQTGGLPEENFQLCDITGAIAAELTGSPVAIEPTFAASWGLWDQTTHRYNEDVLRAAGLDRTCLPRVVATGEELGRVNSQAASVWRLPEGMPVYAGIGDNQASFLGAVNDPSTEVLVNVGTGGQVAWCSEAQTDGPAIEIRPYLEGQYLHVGAGLAGGDAYAWLASQLQRWLAEFGIKVAESQLHRTLAEAHAALSEAQKAEAPICEPYFRGTRLEPERRGLLSHLGQENVGLGQLVHAVVAGVVDSLCELYENAEAPLPDRQRVVVGGNFFEHHRWAADRIAERWQIPVTFPDQQEQAARGAALLASRHSDGR